MFSLYRTTLSALCLSLILPLTAQAQDGEKPQTPAAPQDTPAAREALAERSQLEAQALERQVPKAEQQTLDAGNDRFLALWKPANSPSEEGTLILLPGAGETADWPKGIGPLRRKFPDVQWSTLSLSLPDLLAERPVVRSETKAPAPQPADESKAAPASDKPANANANIAQATAAETESADANDSAAAPAGPEENTDAERIFARIDAAVAYAQQQSARNIVLLGHGSGAYWAARYISERQPAQVQKLVMVSAQTPARMEHGLDSLIGTLKVPVADFYFSAAPQARQAAEQRLQASKRLKDSRYRQVALSALPDRDADQEQLFRRIRGWLSPSQVD